MSKHSATTPLGRESAAATSSRTPDRNRYSRLFTAAIVLGVLAHLVVAAVAANRPATPWGGGGDAREYVGLANNLLAGYGYTFAHQPTAFRAPGYPILLAGIMRMFPTHWLVALHLFQFLTSLLAAVVCGSLAGRWFGSCARRAAIAMALLLPTLLYFSGEVLTECIAALVIITYLYWLDEAVRKPRSLNLVLLGVTGGLAALVRFNAVPLIPIAAFAVFKWPATNVKDRWKRMLTLALPCAVVLAPWILHNAIAFHGHVLYSTHGGFAAVEGVLMPLGRTQPRETELIEKELGWGNWNVETDTPDRPELRDEVKLDHQAWHVAFRLWRARGFALIPVGISKVAAFWLSTDQLIDVRSFSERNRLIRRIGVAAYWVVLVLAVSGWRRLRELRSDISSVILLFAAVLVVAHLPLTMNTRLRVPLFDPLLTSLAGGAVSRRLYPSLRNPD